MAAKKAVVAICYDFDGTLSPGNMQEYGFFSGLGDAAKSFWSESEKQARSHGADPILSYMNHMIEKAKIGNIGTTKEAFKEYGKTVQLFPGVADWFDRMKTYGKDRNVMVEHYIVSSGLREMIQGTAIGRKFKKIYACSFIYDNNNAARWPAVAVNYTTKTQFLFRINKGIEDDNDHTSVNKHVLEQDRRIPFFRMIYIGDGLTDIPCMKLVKDKGGCSIAVYDPDGKRKKKTEAEKLLKDGRVNFVANANYTDGELIDQIVKAVIDNAAATFRLSVLSKKKRTKSGVSENPDDSANT